MPCEECEVESYLSFPTAFSHISSLSPTEVVRQSIDLVPVYLTYKMCKVYVNLGNFGNDSEYIYNSSQQASGKENFDRMILA